LLSKEVGGTGGGSGRFSAGLGGISRVLLFVLMAGAVSAAQNSNPASAPAASSNLPGPDAGAQVPDPNPQPPSAEPQAPDTVSNPGEEPGFVFKREVEEVVLHAIAVDDQNHLVTSLGRDNFQVYEDGKPQRVTSFGKERVPVALGILIDNSGSMLPKRAKVNEAALQLADASQEGDRVFVVNFGDDAFLDQDYTQDVGKLKAALQRVETRGSTALYDAVIGAVNHLDRSSPLEKKILLVVTDGRDNSSQATFQEVLRKLQSKNGPVLYSIALEQDDRRDDANRQSLRALCEQTGGTAFFPSSLDEVQSIASTIARDIRSQYVIGYRSSNPHTAGTYHRIQVQAQPNGGSNRLRVETRTGYYSGQEGSK
jgi:Ca-activated chloride channel homolog